MMEARLRVFTETGAKRVFASAMDWPGWSRGGKTESLAIEDLLAHGERYARVVAAIPPQVVVPADPSGVDVVERLEGNANTDFGVPGRWPARDDDPLIDPEEADRLAAILEAAWAAFDAAADSARGVPLATGPRGGGRDLVKLVEHVWGADGAYHAKLGHPYRTPAGTDPAEDMPRLRASAITAFRSRAAREPLPPSRQTSTPWPARYYIRRAAWHALDHAWEIEDRSGVS